MRSHHCDLQIRMNRSIIISRLVDHELEQREEIESGCSSCPYQVLSIQMRVMRDYADPEQPTTGQQSSKIESSGKKIVFEAARALSSRFAQMWFTEK